MNLAEALKHLNRIDPEMQRILQGNLNLSVPQPKGNFEFLVSSIISQQLSLKAAATIYGRFLNLLDNHVHPQKILNAAPNIIRSAGLSTQKTGYIYALAQAFSEAPKVYENLYLLSDKEVIAELTKIKGIGVWTAEMFLMFNLLRTDIFPIGDLGIRRGMELFFFDGAKKNPQELITRAEIWRPYRTIACYAIWKVQDTK